MKHIKIFEEFTQSLSEAITLDEFKALKPGQVVHYMGTGYNVVKCDGLTLDLKNPDEDETISVNYNMFKSKGFINESVYDNQSLSSLQREFWIQSRTKMFSKSDEFSKHLDLFKTSIDNIAKTDKVDVKEIQDHLKKFWDEARYANYKNFRDDNEKFKEMEKTLKLTQ